MDHIREFFDIAFWADWFAGLDRTFVFLLLLPFVVTIVGVWAGYRDRTLGQPGEVQGQPGKRVHEHGESAVTNGRDGHGPALRE